MGGVCVTLACFQTLLGASALPNAVNKDGNTALHVACAEGSINIVITLIK